METFTPISAAIGGALIGIAASILLVVNGRVAGISGILGEALRGDVRADRAFRLAFLAGLAFAGIGCGFARPEAIVGPPVTLPFVVVAGLVVGYGTRLGNGCTSGHGVCGVARFSKRSIVATITFMLTGGLTAFVVRHVVGVAR